ncbi:hypothetical protein F8568_028765 [Actinomadura sp. LD22]|uniref:Uncharacterized protein n=1 Tax=Actinomadura physcomitrii TaxID=2650748 RepID=A0A6I4MHC9_9ACTN|nr:hypothetical protein [Actinomadura physcomitrii]MWA04300.1 hypothetical protein [Actinomadura physcomitrii]
MNGIEERLKDAFGARADAVRPHPGVRAENDRRIRRSRTRRRVAAPALALAAVATAAAVPAGLRDGPHRADPNTVAGGRSPGNLVDPATIVAIPAAVPGGGTFTPEALGADGSVAGRTADGRVYTAGPKGGRPRPLGVRAEGGLAAGKGFVTWIAPGSWKLSCRTSGGRTGTIGPQGATPADPVLAGGGAVVGDDPMAQPFAATGCGDTGRTLDNHGKGVLGQALALAYPTLFVADTSNDDVVREIDLRTQAITAQHPLPPGVRPLKLTGETEQPEKSGKSGPGAVYRTVPGTGPDQKWRAAANQEYFASLADGKLRIVARDGWRTVTTLDVARPRDAKAADGARITAGDHVVAYTSGGISGLIDTRTLGTGRTHPTAVRTAITKGPVLAAGDWLLWRDGSAYRLGRVR